MTKADLLRLLADYPDTARIFVWPFDGPQSADKITVGAYLPSSEHDMPAVICLKPEVED